MATFREFAEELAGLFSLVHRPISLRAIQESFEKKYPDWSNFVSALIDSGVLCKHNFQVSDVLSTSFRSSAAGIEPIEPSKVPSVEDSLCAAEADDNLVLVWPTSFALSSFMPALRPLGRHLQSEVTKLSTSKSTKSIASYFDGEFKAAHERMSQVDAELAEFEATRHLSDHRADLSRLLQLQIDILHNSIESTLEQGQSVVDQLCVVESKPRAEVCRDLQLSPPWPDAC